MNENLLNTEIDKLDELYEGLKECIYGEMPVGKMNKALGLLVKIRDQSAINIQRLAAMDVGAVYPILEELERAETKHPAWPSDPIHAAAVVQEECGEMVKAAVQYVYEGGEEKALLVEAIQTGAMAIRFLKNFDSRRTSRDVTDAFDCSAT